MPSESDCDCHVRYYLDREEDLDSRELRTLKDVLERLRAGKPVNEKGFYLDAEEKITAKEMKVLKATLQALRDRP